MNRGTRMDGLGPGRLDGLENAINAQVALRRSGRTLNTGVPQSLISTTRRLQRNHAVRVGESYDADRLVSHADVGGLGVGLRVDRDRLDAQTLARAHHAARDLPAVGHQHLVEQLLFEKIE